MPSSSSIAQFRRGVITSLPVVTAVMPVGAVFGALAVAKGLTPAETIISSATMYAAASQFVAIDMFGARVPGWSIILSVFAVNFRHLLYSAAITPLVRPLPWRIKGMLFPLLVDPVFAFVEKDRAEGRSFSVAAYFGIASAMWIAWVGSTAIGAMFGRLITHPERFALDMLLPIYFLALVMGFHGKPRFWLTGLVSAAVSALVYHAPALGIPLGPPWHVTIGGLAGILVAAFAAPRGGPVTLEEVALAEAGAPEAGAAGAGAR